MSLLEKALTKHRRIRNGKEVEADDLELAIAFFESRITTNQAAFAWGKNTGGIPNHAASIIRNAIAQGIVRIVIAERKAAQ